MKATIKLDTAKFEAATRELANFATKKEPVAVMRSAAGQVVRKVVDLTPPAQGKADKAAQKRGELAIVADIGKIAIPVTGRFSKKQGREILASQDELLAAHARARSHSQGRVNPRNRKEKLLVEQRVYLAVLRILMAKVGVLAAGWNSAARSLNVRLPAWITRHRSIGYCTITATRSGIRIQFGNAVRFGDDVEGLGKSLQKAIDSVAKNMIETQIPQAMKTVAKRAGFKVS